MRTDSNTVLPLPSGVSSKKSAMIKLPSETGADFHADFQHAKNAADTLSSTRSLPTSDTSTTEVSEQKSIADTNQQDSTAVIEHSASKEPDELSVDTASSTSNSTVQKQSQQGGESASFVDQGGNALQAGGEKTPDAVSVLTSDKSNKASTKIIEPNTIESKGGFASLAPHDQRQNQSDKVLQAENSQGVTERSRLAGVMATSGTLEASEMKPTAESALLPPHTSDFKAAEQVQVSIDIPKGVPSSPVQTSSAQGLTTNSNAPVSESVTHRPSNVLSSNDGGLPLGNTASANNTGQTIQSNGATPDDAVFLAAPTVIGGTELQNADGQPDKTVLDVGTKSRSNVASPATLAALTGLAKVDHTTKKSALTDVVQTTDKIDLAPVEAPDELSWVLSQMGTSSSKSATKSLDDGLVSNGVTALSSNGSSALHASDGTKTAAILATGIALNDEELVTAETSDVLLEEEVLLNEPVELRKKEQEAMLGRMSAQADSMTGEKERSNDSTTGGLNSSLQTSVARPTAAAGVLNAAANSPQANAMTMSVPPGHPGWAGEMTQKVVWVARDGGHTAHIRLDPPELGSLTVKVSVDSDSNTQVSFVAATPQARDLLESQMGRLRDMLAQQGMDLSRADVDVSQQDTAGAQYKDNERNNNGARNGAMASDDSVEDDLIAANTSYVSASGVDYYA